MIDKQAIRMRWEAVGGKLGERDKRLFAAGEGRAAGRGGKAAVAEVTGRARARPPRPHEPIVRSQSQAPRAFGRCSRIHVESFGAA